MEQPKAFSLQMVSECSTAAREFLEEFERSSYKVIDPMWIEMSEDEIIEKACFSFNMLDNDMKAATTLKQSGGIH